MDFKYSSLFALFTANAVALAFSLLLKIIFEFYFVILLII